MTLCHKALSILRDLAALGGRMTYVNRRRFLAAAGSTSLALALEPAALARRLGGTWLTLATADLESHVAVLDGWKLTPVGRIRTGPGPRSIESARDGISVVAHTEHGVVSLLDVDTRGIYVSGYISERIRVRSELDRFAAPRYTAVHPRLPVAYVTDSDAEEVVTIDLRRARVVARTRVPGPARHVSISRDGQTLWTALGSVAARIAVLDTSDHRRPRLVRTFAPPFASHDVVFAPDGTSVWVTSGDERRLAILERSRRVRHIVAAGSPPQHVAFGSGTAFVASGDDGTLRRHRLDGALVREARVPVGSYNVAFGSGLGVTPSLSDGSVTSLAADGRTLARRDVGLAAHDACVVFGP